MRYWERYNRLYWLSVLLLTWAGCSDSGVDNTTDAYLANRVSLAINISTNRNVTRMSETVTHQTGQSYRGIQGLKLFPFNIESTIGENKLPLQGMEYEMEQNEDVRTNYFDNHSVKIPDGTASFLCYAQAVPATTTGSVTDNSDFVNGSITATGLDVGIPNTSSISFAPKVINSNDVGDNASKIATYLTAIANAIPDEEHDFFLKFINRGHPVASSSRNAEKLAAWAVSEGGVSLAGISKTYDDSYPSNINLPDGAAVVKWNTATGEFEPQPVTTTEANVNRLDRFIYPAELWYYANSRIKTSFVSQADNYGQSWDAVLAGYENDNGVMEFSVHSVAVKDPLSYAVGCLQVGLVVNNTLTDANEEQPTTITLSSTVGETEGTFPLRAVFVGGQHAQAFNFTPKNDNTEYIIYDKEITGITMGDAKTPTPSKHTNTLVFQTQDGMSVRFALEFENNTNENFWGVNGIVFAGTKFYLVGNIKVPTGQAEDYKKRAFTKAYTTQGTVTISSLKQAYTYLPDLMDPRLEIGIELVPSWIQSTTTNVPL